MACNKNLYKYRAVPLRCHHHNLNNQNIIDTSWCTCENLNIISCKSTKIYIIMTISHHKNRYIYIDKHIYIYTIVNTIQLHNTYNIHISLTFLKNIYLLRSYIVAVNYNVIYSTFFVILHIYIHNIIYRRC